jgi:hypothetical protein
MDRFLDGRRPNSTVSRMAEAGEVHLVRVLTDDGEPRLWAAAASHDEAVNQVLNAIPEGWVAKIYDGGKSGERVLEGLNLQRGEVREITQSS